jgi:hypothetical protein
MSFFRSHLIRKVARNCLSRRAATSERVVRATSRRRRAQVSPVIAARKNGGPRVWASGV